MCPGPEPMDPKHLVPLNLLDLVRLGTGVRISNLADVWAKSRHQMYERQHQKEKSRQVIYGVRTSGSVHGIWVISYISV